MQYHVIDENGIDNVEFDIHIDFGFVFDADEVEPDLLLNWLNYDRVAPVGAAPEPVDELPVEDEPDVLDEEDD